MTAPRTYAAIVVAGLTALAGCVGDDGPQLRLTTLGVTGETDFGLLDVEVHLFDATSHQHLGCSGQYEGLEDVDASDVTYQVDAWFREPDRDVEVQPSALTGRSIELQVIEDDLARCPAPPGPDDDVVGISPPLDRSVFDAGQPLAFDNVTAIRIVID